MMELAAMRDLDLSEAPGPGVMLRRAAGLIAIVTAAFFCLGVVAGILAAHAEKGGPLRPELIAILAVAAIALGGLAWLFWRFARAIYVARAGATPRERLNFRFMIAAAALGGGIAVALAAGNHGDPAEMIFSNAPIAAWLAIALAVVVALLLPALCIYWHRYVADEQEAAAYRHGSLVALYVYLLGAPTWWLLWRGGLVPAPDGIVIYAVVTAVAGVFWFRAKYH